MDLTYGGFLAYAREYWKEYPSQREGQMYFNALFLVRKDIAIRVYGTNVDPFYRDENIGKFLRFVEGELNGSVQ